MAGFALTISEAIMPPMDSPIMVASGSVIFSLNRKAYERKLSFSKGSIQSINTGWQNDKSSLLKTVLSAPNPLIR